MVGSAELIIHTRAQVEYEKLDQVDGQQMGRSDGGEALCSGAGIEAHPATLAISSTDAIARVDPLDLREGWCARIRER